MTAEPTGPVGLARRSPLDGSAAAFAALPPAVRVRELALRTHLDLRCAVPGPAAEAVAAVLGTALPTVANTSARAGDVEVLWLGPDEWLVVAPPGRDDLEPSLRAALHGHGAVVEVSAQRTTIALSGPGARGLLAHGCSFDLHPRVSPAGTCVPTRVALTGAVVVVRDDTASDFWLLVGSSSARYLADWLIDAAAELRGGAG